MEKTFPSIYIKSIKIQNFNRIENFECKIKRQIVIFKNNEETGYSKDLIDAIKWCFCLKSTGECFETVLRNEKIFVKITAKCGAGDVTFYKELCKGKEKYIVSRTRQDFKNYRRICEALYDSVAFDLFFISEEDKYKNIKKLISDCAIKSINKKSIITEEPKDVIAKELETQSEIIKTEDECKLIFDKNLDAQFVKDKKVVSKYNVIQEKLRAYYTKLVWNKIITKLSMVNEDDSVYPINRPPIFLDNLHNGFDELQTKLLYENILNTISDTNNPYQIFIVDSKDVVDKIISKNSKNVVVINISK